MILITGWTMAHSACTLMISPRYIILLDLLLDRETVLQTVTVCQPCSILLPCPLSEVANMLKMIIIKFTILIFCFALLFAGRGMF